MKESCNVIVNVEIKQTAICVFNYMGGIVPRGSRGGIVPRGSRGGIVPRGSRGDEDSKRRLNGK